MFRKKQKQETTTPPQVVKEAEPQKRFSAFTDEPSVIPAPKEIKTAEVNRDGDVRGRKYEVSTEPRAKVVSTTSVKNPMEIPDDYNPENKYGVDDRLLAYFYTKTEIDEMGGFPDWEIPDKPVPNLDAILLRLDALEKHTHDYDGDLINDLIG